jgi:hypothetical protein
LTTANQTLTNKVFTSPVINSPTVTSGSFSGITVTSGTLSNPTLTSPTVSSGLTVTGGITTDKLTITGVNNTSGWLPIGQTITYATNTGAREYTVTAPADLTGTISVGNKILIPRTTTPPTQSGAFVSTSSQFAQNTSPSGITFTGAFSIEAWIYINSYTYSEMDILSRDQGSTSGWTFALNTNGCLTAFFRGPSSTTTQATTYKSVPTKQWVHVAMVANPTTPSIFFYVDGVSWSQYYSGNTAVSVSQGGNLQIGARTVVSNSYFNGYISEVRLWSTNLSAATILANMSISISPSSTNLVGYWQMNGNFNDATTNANNLTANGGAVATQLTNPYNANEYGIVTKISYSSPNTTLTLFTGNSNTIPNQTLGTSYYSNARAPYAFPVDAQNWTVNCLILQGYNTSITASSVWQFVTPGNFVVPTGAWKIGYESYIEFGSSSAAAWDPHLVVTSNATPNFNDTNMVSKFYTGAVQSSFGITFLRSNRFVNTFATNYYMFLSYTSGGTSPTYTIGQGLTGINAEGTRIYAEFTYI